MPDFQVVWQGMKMGIGQKRPGSRMMWLAGAPSAKGPPTERTGAWVESLYLEHVGG
jgi:hypothetical protein